MRAWNRHVLSFLLIIALAILVSACASQKAGVKSPELPPRHWLDEAPGVPVENKEKLDAALPNLYDPAKTFSFDDCVFLTIQQSPCLSTAPWKLKSKAGAYRRHLEVPARAAHDCHGFQQPHPL